MIGIMGVSVFMTKLLALCLTAVLCVVGFTSYIQDSMQIHSNLYTPLHVTSLAALASNEDNLTALTIETENFSTHRNQPPAERVETHLYVYCGRRVYTVRLDDAGGQFLITEDGVPIMDNSYNNRYGAIVVHDIANNEFINGANQALQTMLDSRSIPRHYLRNGGRVVGTMGIRADSQIILTKLRMRDNNTMLIYAFMRRYRVSFGSSLNPIRWITGNFYEYRIFDLNGTEISRDRVVEFSFDVAQTTAVLNHGSPISLGIAFIFSLGMSFIRFPLVLSHGTLGELRETVRHATYHPWDRLSYLNQQVRTSHDNELVFMRPSTAVGVAGRPRQLYSMMGAPIFSIYHSGLPVIHYRNDIWAIDRDGTRHQKPLSSTALLLNSRTEEQFFTYNVEFYIRPMTTPLGVFSMLVFNQGTPVDPDWRTPTGSNANDRIDETNIIGDGEQLADVIRRWFDGDGGSILRFLLALIGIILVVVLLAKLIPFLTVIGKPATMFASKVISDTGANIQDGISAFSSKIERQINKTNAQQKNNKRGNKK